MLEEHIEPDQPDILRAWLHAAAGSCKPAMEQPQTSQLVWWHSHALICADLAK
jgi:hypothetical protein